MAVRFNSSAAESGDRCHVTILYWPKKSSVSIEDSDPKPILFTLIEAQSQESCKSCEASQCLVLNLQVSPNMALLNLFLGKVLRNVPATRFIQEQGSAVVIVKSLRELENEARYGFCHIMGTAFIL